MKLLLTITVDTLNKMSPNLAAKTLEIMVDNFGEPEYKPDAMGWQINDNRLELMKRGFDLLPVPGRYADFMKHFNMTVLEETL